jgi:hypothetical protein
VAPAEVGLALELGTFDGFATFCKISGHGDLLYACITINNHLEAYRISGVHFVQASSSVSRTEQRKGVKQKH